MTPTICVRCGRVLGYDLPDADLEQLVAHHDDPIPPQSFRLFLLRRLVTAATVTGAVVLLGAVALFLVALAASGGRLSASVVLSGSMRPAIQPGDVAVLQRVPVSSLRVGDVVAYLPPGQTVPRIHRLVSVDGATVQTRGDANQVADAPVVLRGSDAYRLAAVVPYVGWLWAGRAALWIVAGLSLFAALALALGREVSPLTLRH